MYVVDGRFEMVIRGERHELGPGDVAHVPCGVVHSGRTLGDAPGRRVLVFTPAGMERFFLSAGADSPDRVPAAGDLLAVAREHGWQFGD